MTEYVLLHPQIIRNSDLIPANPKSQISEWGSSDGIRSERRNEGFFWNQKLVSFSNHAIIWFHFSHVHSNHSNLTPFRCYFLIHCLFVSWNEPGMIGNDLISCSVSNHSRPGMRQEWFNILNIWCCLFIIWSITDPAARTHFFKGAMLQIYIN